MKLNVWQKSCIALGALIIALMFLAFPVQGERVVRNPNYNPNSTGYFNHNEYEYQSFIDYNSTSLRCIGVVAATTALTVLFGLTKEEGKENQKS